jgi:hypothetical protein
MKNEDLPTKRMAEMVSIRTTVFLAMVSVLTPVAAQDTNAIVRVTAGNSGGTGTLVAVDADGCGYVVTCKHVTSPHQEATATFRTGYSSTGPVLGTGAAYDTAVFRIRAPDGIEPIPIATEPAEAGVNVEVFGYGGQPGPVQNIKLIRWSSPVRGYEPTGRARRILLDPLPESGDSGGPIVCEGQLVGIVSGYSHTGNGQRLHGLGAYSTPIQNLLAEVQTQYGCQPAPMISSPYGRRQPVPLPSISPIQKPDICQPPPPGPSCDERFAELRKAVADLDARIQAQLDAIETTPGPPGDVGPQGEPGAAGTPGPPGEITEEQLQQIAALVLAQMQSNPEPFRGPPGRDGQSIVIGALTDEEITRLAQRLPPIYPRWISPTDGSVIDEIPGGVSLGDKLDLRLDRKVVNATGP